MSTFFVNFVIGTVSSGLIFLLFTKLSKEASFSLPIAPLFIGFLSGNIAHFVSPWATPVVVILYFFSSLSEYRNEQTMKKKLNDDLLQKSGRENNL